MYCWVLPRPLPTDRGLFLEWGSGECSRTQWGPVYLQTHACIPAGSPGGGTSGSREPAQQFSATVPPFSIHAGGGGESPSLSSSPAFGGVPPGGPRISWFRSPFSEAYGCLYPLSQSVSFCPHLSGCSSFYCSFVGVLRLANLCLFLQRDEQELLDSFKSPRRSQTLRGRGSGGWGGGRLPKANHGVKNQSKLTQPGEKPVLKNRKIFFFSSNELYQSREASVH